MAVLEPELCAFSMNRIRGLDIDALKIVSQGVNALRDGKRAFIIVTHYQRILDYIKPDYVHVLYQGRIVKSGDFSLVKQLEEQGYGWLGPATAVTRCSSGTICLKRRAARVPRRPVSICSSCCALGCRRASTRTGNTLRWMPYLTVALSPMRGPLSVLNSVMRWRCRWTPGGWCLSMAAIILS